MRIKTIGVRGALPDAPLQADFGLQGGCIGRGSHCTLVLPDPYRHVSRTHAELAWVDGRWLLTDCGSANAVVRNGCEIGRGRQVPLAHGDILVLGDYELQVEIEPAQAEAPTGAGASLLPPTQFWNSLLPKAAPAGPLVELSDRGAAHAPAFSPPDAALPPNPLAPDPKTQLHAPGAPAARDVSMPPSAGKRSGLDDDAITAAGLQEPAPESLDVLFGLDLADSRGFGALPRGQVRPDAWGQGALRVDPIEALGLADSQPAPAAPVADRTPGWQQCLVLPGALSADAPCAAPAAAGKPLRDSCGKADVALMDTSPDALLAQLLAGLQMPGLPRALGDTRPAAPLDAQLMHRVGELLRLSLQGTLALLAARSTVKQELRAGLTVIADRANNPLKFSPDVLSALTHLLSPQPAGGFMEPAAAVREACDDLLAHELACAAAMRVAMRQLVERFDPARLEARLAGNRRMLDALVPGARKARLWELFGEWFGQIAREADNDFEALFGAALRSAYEQRAERPSNARQAHP